MEKNELEKFEAELYTAAYAAHRNTSFDPEKRAAQVITALRTTLETNTGDLTAWGVSAADIATYTSTYIEKLKTALAAQSRVASPMIVGPANFPAERIRKADESAGKRWEELWQWNTKTLNRYRKNPTGEVVKFTLEDELKCAKAKTSVTAEGRRRAKARVAELEKKIADRDAAPVSSTSFEGGKIVMNREIDRVQIVYDQKPDPETIVRLKRSGWRWSPKNAAWQRQLTRNAVDSAREVTNRK